MPEKEFKCEKCGKTFGSRKKLDKHVKKCKKKGDMKGKKGKMKGKKGKKKKM